MKNTRLLTILTLLNCLLLTLQATRALIPVHAADPPAVLRARSLEIVDERGRVRASIKLHPSQVFAPTGKRYPETVMFRLIDANGRPEVKLGASEQGGGLSLIGENDATQLLLEAEHSSVTLKMKSKDGKERLFQP
ncbi:MAG: hypothetical protein K2X35_02675 [Bryobacteraceae bacterium]|nr:hypothetical protein [Bryobacteraceae bacterium]